VEDSRQFFFLHPPQLKSGEAPFLLLVLPIPPEPSSFLVSRKESVSSPVFFFYPLLSHHSHLNPTTFVSLFSFPSLPLKREVPPIAHLSARHKSHKPTSLRNLQRFFFRFSPLQNVPTAQIVRYREHHHVDRSKFTHGLFCSWQQDESRERLSLNLLGAGMSI